MTAQVHYEVFSRKTPQASWVLQMAIEDRDVALASAEDLLKTNKAAAIKVTKEVFSDENGEFRSYVLITKGDTDTKPKKRLVQDSDAVCTSPQDLYTKHAREKIAVLLEDWLRRQGATPFELLHRPDLCERLEASSNELMHAIQKIAVPEAQDTGQPIHELMRRWNGLTERALGRVIADGRKKIFPDIDPENFTTQLAKIAAGSERAYVLGGAIAKYLSGERSPAKKLERLLTLIEPLAENVEAHKWALEVLEAPVTELFALRNVLSDILDEDADLGTALGVLTRLAAGPEVELVAKFDAQVTRILPPVTGVLHGYAALMTKGLLGELRLQIFRRLMQDLRGPKRLKPQDPMAEIDVLRAMAMALTAVGGQQTQREDITEAFSERSKMLVASPFVEALTHDVTDVIEETERLIWLCENVAGGANKRQAARWLMSALTGMKFERDLRDPKRTAGARLAALAQLQKRIIKANLGEKDTEDAQARIGHVGGLVAQDVHLIAHVVKGSKNDLQRLLTLLSFATGQAGPTGPVCEAAKAEVMKQLRLPDVRAYIFSDPSVFANLRPLLIKAGIGAA